MIIKQVGNCKPVEPKHTLFVWSTQTHQNKFDHCTFLELN